MYGDFKNIDLDFYEIIENAKKFGLDINDQTLRFLFDYKAPDFNENDLKQINEMINALKKVRENSQMSGD